MQITVTRLGKRFNREWIFRGMSYAFEAGQAYAITGSNGSGKSTLLQVIAGAVMLSEGSVSYSQHGKTIEPEQLYRNIAIAAPYLELIEEMTALELLQFHEKFRSFVLPVTDALAKVGLQNAAGKEIRYFSSGMKQRLKLAQAVFSNSPVLLLDEPCTNLDAAGIALYQQLMTQYAANRIVIVSSNDPQEYGFCNQVLSISDYKQFADIQ